MLIEAPLQYFFSFEEFKASKQPFKYQNKLQFGAEAGQIT